MIKRMILMLVLVALVVAVIAGVKASGFKKQMAMMQAAGSVLPVVSSIKVNAEPWQVTQSVVGSLRATQGVDVANELAGIVQEIYFESGGDVRKGALLITLRAEDDIAKLHALEASAKLSRTVLERDKKQYAAHAVSKAALDTDVAKLESDNALVGQQKALVEKKFIHAPFSGHLGIRNVDLGQYLTPGTAVVTLQALDPIYLDFYLPQQALAQIAVGQKLAVHSDAYAERDFNGSVIAIDPKVDTTTRNVKIRAALKNPDKALLPGMYATAQVNIGKVVHYVTAPQTAITYNPYGNTVFVLHETKGDDAKAKLTAEQVFVTLGEKRGDQVAIIKGLKAGDEVVTSGQIKLQNGAGVTVDNKIIPKNDIAPKPQDK